MTDRELLELAAKAAGIEVHRGKGWQRDTLFRAVPDPHCTDVTSTEWNPLADDGDALRLLNKLWLELRHVHGSAHAGRPGQFWCTEPYFPDGDINAATRLAIVRAAAEIGKAMP